MLIVDAQPGSLILTVKCPSLEILEELWNDYCTGRLNEMAQKFLVTVDILIALGLTAVRLTTTILDEDYRACREYFVLRLGEFKGLVHSRTSTKGPFSTKDQFSWSRRTIRYFTIILISPKRQRSLNASRLPKY